MSRIPTVLSVTRINTAGQRQFKLVNFMIWISMKPLIKILDFSSHKQFPFVSELIPVPGYMWLLEKIEKNY